MSRSNAQCQDGEQFATVDEGYGYVWICFHCGQAARLSFNPLLHSLCIGSSPYDVSSFLIFPVHSCPVFVFTKADKLLPSLECYHSALNAMGRDSKDLATVRKTFHH